MSDFTKHKDRKRRENYISRHKKDLRTNDPMRPGYLSMYILWNKPTVSASLADYKRRLNTYNKTGKFPKGITGSKKLSFGTSSIIPVKGTLLDRLPDEIILEKLQKPRSAEKIQKVIRGRAARKIPKNMMTKKHLKYLLWKMNVDFQDKEYADAALTKVNNKYLEAAWVVLNPFDEEVSRWLYIAAEVLTADDFKNDPLWYKCLEEVLTFFVEEDPDRPSHREANPMTEAEARSIENIEVLLSTIGFTPNFEEYGWYNDAILYLINDYPHAPCGGVLSQSAAPPSWQSWFGKKQSKKSTGSKIPDNVVNKALYSRIKAKIRRDVNKKKRRWGAYDSGRLVREYKAKGGKYRGGKGKTNLGRWYKEKWVDACAWPKRKSCGRKTKEKIAYCRPSKKVDSKTPKLVQSLSKSQIKSRCAKKKRSPQKRITGFGKSSIIPLKGTMFDKLPEDILYELQGPRAATQISTNYRKYELNKLYNSSKVFGKFNKKSLEWVKKLSIFISNENKNEIKWRKLLITILADTSFQYTLYYALRVRGEPLPVLERDPTDPRGVRNDQVTIKLLLEIIKYVGVIYKQLGCNDLYLFIMQNDMSNITRDNVMKLNRAVKATKECFGSWNKTNFGVGVTTPDKRLPYGDGGWVLHCSYHDWGAHATLRYKPFSGPRDPGGDYSYHYGIHNDGTLRFWSTGATRGSEPSNYLKQMLIDYYNRNCNKIELTKQARQDFYITDQYGSNLNLGKKRKRN